MGILFLIPGVSAMFDTNTSAMLHFNGTGGSTSAPDATGYQTWTYVGGGAINTSTYKFGGASMFFNASPAGVATYFSTPNSSKFELGTQNWTIRTWVKKSKTGALQYYFGQLNDAGVQGSLYAGNLANDKFVAYSNIGGTEYPLQSVTAFPDTNWHLMEITRNGNDFYLFIDGIINATDSRPGTIMARSNPWTVGRAGNWTGSGLFTGHLDEFQFVLGQALYITNHSVMDHEYWGTANFTATTLSGFTPLTVSFADATTGFTPTAWNWTFGDGNYSAEQNPTFIYNIPGVYTVRFEASNTTVNSTREMALKASNEAPAPNFNANITSGKKPLVVQFYDMTTNLSSTPISGYDWSFELGGGNSTDKDPLRTFTSSGYYDINLIATNDIGSNQTLKPDYINVSEYIGFTRQDLNLTGSYTLGEEFRNSEDHALITDIVEIETTGIDVNSYNTTSGKFNLTTNYGLVTLHVTSENYNGKYETYVMDHDQSDTIYLTPIPEPGNLNTWYTPHQVRFTVINQYGAPVQNATVSANAINATIPDSWLQIMYGINPEAANDMLNGTLIMQGITSTDGAIVFTMHGSIRYNINVTDPATGSLFSTSVMPIGADYPIRTSPYAFPQASNSTYNQIANTSLTFSEPNSSYVTLGLVYQDTSGRTTNLKFYVTAVHNRTVVYSVNLGDPGTAVRYANFTLRNERGYQYIWNYTAVRT